MSILELAGLYALCVLLVLLICWDGKDFGKPIDRDYSAHNPNIWLEE
jgi:hypothetical protein